MFTIIKNTRQRAMTLIEILVVIMVLGVVGGISGGVYAGSYHKMQVRRAALAFLVMMRTAQMRAIELQQPMTLHIEQQSGQVWVTYWKANEDGTTAEERIAEDPMLKRIQLHESVMLERVEINAERVDRMNGRQTSNVITFAPDGTSDNAVIQIGNGRIHYTLTAVSASGRIYLTKGVHNTTKQYVVDLEAQESS